MEFTLIHLALAWLTFALLLAYLITKLPKSYKLKFVLIPIAFVLALYIGVTTPHLLGYAYPGRPKGTFTYVNHVVKGNEVSLLVRIHGHLRLYKFKGNSQIEAQLAMAKGDAQKGQADTGKFTPIKGKFSFPGLYPSMSPLVIHSPHIYGKLPPKNGTD